MNNNILTRGVESIISKEELEQLLLQPQKIRVYFGIDPTNPFIHFGHTVPLRQLAKFQALGAKTILLIGDFTAMIGDPSGRDKQRSQLTQPEVAKNVETYLAQAKKIIPIDDPKNPVEVVFNSSWHAQMNQAEMFGYLQLLTLQQFIERDLFQARIKKKLPLALSEFLYPYLQGYDAVKLNADVQIGGSDQLFNMMISRDLVKKLLGKNQTIITTPLLLGIDGQKMSKSFGNTINISDSPDDIYGKVMSIRDDLVINYFELLTDASPGQIEIYRKSLKTDNPRTVKAKLAHQLVEIIYGKSSANNAEAQFDKIFSRREIPEEVEAKKIESGKTISQILILTGLAESNSEGHRLISQGGVNFAGEKVIDPKQIITNSGLLKVGKRKFIKIMI